MHENCCSRDETAALVLVRAGKSLANLDASEGRAQIEPKASKSTRARLESWRMRTCVAGSVPLACRARRLRFPNANEPSAGSIRDSDTRVRIISSALRRKTAESGDFGCLEPARVGSTRLRFILELEARRFASIFRSLCRFHPQIDTERSSGNEIKASSEHCASCPSTLDSLEAGGEDALRLRLRLETVNQIGKQRKVN
jgi:hypothetical protein